MTSALKIEIRRRNMKSTSAVLAATFAVSLTLVGQAYAATTFYGPSAYVTQADAPFQAGDFDAFYLEDVEDNAIDTLGLGVSGVGLCITGHDCFVGGGVTDSVGNGGNGQLGRSIFTQGSTTITFDAMALGGLPTFAGLVWTDGNNPIVFEAYDQGGVLLGVLNGSHADGSFFGTLGDDRFYGVSHDGGISRLVISNPPGTEVDHIQYGLNRVAAIPEPGVWAMLTLGFAGLGTALRSRRRRLAASA